CWRPDAPPSPRGSPRLAGAGRAARRAGHVLRLCPARSRAGQRAADHVRARAGGADRLPGLRARAGRQHRLPRDRPDGLGTAPAPRLARLGRSGYLAPARMGWDRLAAAAAELGVLFTGITIASGSIWGKPTWGTWWTWDARLTSTAILFLVYVGYLLLRAMVDEPERRARFAAVVGIVGAANIPIVHFSVKWWRALHQPST